MEKRELWFHHVGVSVADMDGAIAWWREMLGFDLMRRYHLASIPAEIAILGNGALHVELLCRPDARPADPERRIPDDDLKTLGNKHVAFSVADVRGVIARLREKGVDVVWLKEFPDGRAASFIRDNEGNLIEFVQWAKVEPAKAFLP
ncbi:VOC family protein [Novosphingobium rosa]|uniref:VOC family protein n=1 Tax=Novosphingobium rosa TaxID=76978 RepID=UPI0008313AB4|nr:VOC family protein [Novosphingobium rosa]